MSLMPPIFWSAVFGLAAVEQKLRIRHERRAEPARGHIAHAEIAHDRAAEALGSTASPSWNVLVKVRERYSFFSECARTPGRGSDEITKSESFVPVCEGPPARKARRAGNSSGSSPLPRFAAYGRSPAHFVRKRHEAEASCSCAACAARDATGGVHAVRRLPDMNPITSRDGLSTAFSGTFHIVKPPVFFLTYREKHFLSALWAGCFYDPIRH